MRSRRRADGLGPVGGRIRRVLRGQKRFGPTAGPHVAIVPNGDAPFASAINST